MSAKILLLDRDGTVNFNRPTFPVPATMELLPHTGEGLRLFRDAGYRFFILTNQGAIGDGFDTQENYDACAAKLLQLLKAEGIVIEHVYYCPHARNAGCSCRKPAMGMWRMLIKDHPEADPADALMVGDKDTDVALGHAIGCRTARIMSGEYPETVGADYTVSDLLELAHKVL